MSTVRVLHVIPSLSPTQGGPSFALPAMARALLNEGVEVEVATTDDDGPGQRLTLRSPSEERDGYRIWYFPKQTEFYKVSLPLAKWLREHASRFDLIHIHSVFSFSTIAAAKAAQRAGVPYLVRPLGVLNRWGMEQRRPWLKTWSFRLLDKPLLDHAAGIHFTSIQERDDASSLGLHSPAKILPLGFDLQEFDHLPSPASFHSAFADTADRPLVLFLSRLDPKKNLEGLLQAWKQVKGPARLVISGDGDARYVSHLHQYAGQLGLGDRLLWTGRLEGELKRAALAAATLFVLPSHSENFGIALLEAMASGLPCISTKGVALASESENAVRISTTQPDSLASVIQELIDNHEESARLGTAARELVANRYSLLAMGSALKTWYEEVI